LLCAALISTLVGCGIGYFAIPALEMPARWAMGQDNPSDSPEILQDQYLGELRNATESLNLVTQHSDLISQTANNFVTSFTLIREEAAKIQGCIKDTANGAANLQKAGEIWLQSASDFPALRAALFGSAQIFQQQVSQAEKKLQQQSENLQQGIANLAEACKGVTEIAKAIEHSILTPTGHNIKALTSIGTTIKDKIQGIFQEQSRQNKLVAAMIASLNDLGKSMLNSGDKLSQATKILEKTARRDNKKSVKIMDAMVKIAADLKQTLHNWTLIEGDSSSKSDSSHIVERIYSKRNRSVLSRLLNHIHIRRLSKREERPDDLAN